MKHFLHSFIFGSLLLLQSVVSEDLPPAPSAAPFVLVPTVEPSIYPTFVPFAERVIDIITTDPDLRSFFDLITASEVLQDLASLEDVTFFAPTNEAIAMLDDEFLVRLLEPEWIVHLIDLIAIHVAVPQYLSRELLNGTEIETLSTQKVQVNVADNVPTLENENFEGIPIAEVDLTAPNGVVHKIGEVMTPPFAYFDLVDSYVTESFFFSIFLELVTIANMEDALREEYYTVLAPINAGFRALPDGNLYFLREPGNEDVVKSILENHIVEGLVPSRTLFNGDVLTTLNEPHLLVLQLSADETEIIIQIGGVVVLVFDGLASNGLGYAIEEVLLPDGIVLPAEIPSDMPSDMPTGMPSDMPSRSPAGDQFGSMPSDPPSDVPSKVPGNGGNGLGDILLNEPDLATLYSLVVATGMVEELSQINDVTLFAPTNEAFTMVNEGFLARLLEPEWILHLIGVLSFHIGMELYLAEDLANLDEIVTLTMQVLEVNVTNGIATLQTSQFDGVGIVEADLIGVNAVVHKIDQVLLPTFVFKDLFDSYLEDPMFSILTDLIVIAGLETAVRTEFYTILAPVNTAWESLPAGNLAFLQEPGNVEVLRTVILNHVLEGSVPSESTFQDDRLVTLNGEKQRVVRRTNNAGELIFRIGGSEVLDFDTLANNGLGYALQDVLLPNGIDFSARESDIPSDIPSDQPSEMPADSEGDMPSDSDMPSDMPSDSNMSSDMPSEGNMSSDMPSDVPSSSPSIQVSLVPSAALSVETTTSMPTDVLVSTPPTPAPTLATVPDPTSSPSIAPVQTQSPTQEQVSSAMTRGFSMWMTLVGVTCWFAL